MLIEQFFIVILFQLIITELTGGRGRVRLMPWPAALFVGATTTAAVPPLVKISDSFYTFINYARAREREAPYLGAFHTLAFATRILKGQ